MAELVIIEERCIQPGKKLPNEYTDSELVEGIRSRDDAVFTFLVNRYKHGIGLFVCHNGGTRVDAEDLFNDGIVRLIEIVDKFDFSLKCRLSTLLYAICEKKWKLILLQRGTARKYHLRKNDDSSEVDFTEQVDKSLYSMIFWDSFNRLKDDCKRIFQAYFQELPTVEIAKILNYSYGYLRKRKCMCHKSLIKIVNNHPDYKEIIEKDISYGK